MTPTASDPIPIPRIKLSPARQPPEGIVRPERYDPAMGEVRGTVELANTRNTVLASRGYLPPEQVRRCSVEAVVDKGAVLSVLPAHVVAVLATGDVRLPLVSLHTHVEFNTGDQPVPTA